MSWISLANSADDERFRFFVRDSNQVGPSLELDLLVAAHVMLQNIAGGAGQFECELQILHYCCFKVTMRSMSFT